MSPEYNFYVQATLKDEKEAEKLSERLRGLPGVEIVAATTSMDLVREMSLGELVHYYRMQSGLSMNRLSAFADLSVDTISRIEKGSPEHNVRNITASKIIQGLGFKAEDPRAQLFYEKVEQTNNRQRI